MTKSGQLWGGRFIATPDETFAEFNRSLGFDQRLFTADVRASIAHANGLAGIGVLPEDEAAKVTVALRKMLDTPADAALFDASDAEDVHSFIEAHLIAEIGDLGRKLHTGRSRNDQVATALRLWLRDEIDEIQRLVAGLQKALIDLALRHPAAVMPGYTHLQRAQPIMFAHWCLAYFEMLRRDVDRLREARKRVNVMPLGSGALAGSGFEIDRRAVAAELGFEGVSANSLDAVSDRDFAIELASACSILMVHLSRLAEDVILYCSSEFGFVTLGDAVSSGSSLMPQKKNPDALELIRGKSGRVFGDLMTLLTVMKGLPLAYNKDMQEDKEALFDCVDTVKMSLRCAMVALDNATANEEKMRMAATQGYLNATELADYLARKGMPFRTAHEAVGRLVLLGIETGRELGELSLEELRAECDQVGMDVFDSLSLDQTLASKANIGGTSPERVAEALAAATNSLNRASTESE